MEQEGWFRFIKVVCKLDINSPINWVCENLHYPSAVNWSFMVLIVNLFFMYLHQLNIYLSACI
jgi:hypothetical protein